MRTTDDLIKAMRAISSAGVHMVTAMEGLQRAAPAAARALKSLGIRLDI